MGSVVYVVATSVEGTREALEVATAWARGVSGRAVLLVPRAEEEHAIRQLADVYSPRPDVLACVWERSIDLLQLVHVSGRVVLGGVSRWGWPTAEERLARVLTRAGCHVTFAHVPPD